MARVGSQRYKKKTSLPVALYITQAVCYQRQKYTYSAGRHSVKIYIMKRNVSASFLYCEPVFEKVSLKCCSRDVQAAFIRIQSKRVLNRNRCSIPGWAKNFFLSSSDLLWSPLTQ
jgi:hypothetical protein